jgi:Asp-tRNA(Asn)/Glu-tRNA(Gln) amidotransferase A subunit family amidase
MPGARAPKALAVLETTGWKEAGDAAKSAFLGAVERLASSGVKIKTRRDTPEVEAAEKALERSMLLTRKINAWESRWPLNTFSDRDASKLSQTMRDRLKEAEAMTVEEYRGYLIEREQARETYKKIATVADACITLSAPGEAPVGIKGTGNPVFVVPGTFLGVPMISLPVLACNGLPLGLQVLGWRDKDADLVATAAAIEGLVGIATSVRA